MKIEDLTKSLAQRVTGGILVSACRQKNSEDKEEPGIHMSFESNGKHINVFVPLEKVYDFVSAIKRADERVDEFL